jgi:hypothetical protein
MNEGLLIHKEISTVTTDSYVRFENTVHVKYVIVYHLKVMMALWEEAL